MRPERVAMVAACLVCAAVAQGAEQVVWRIGRPDKSYMEFAIARSYPAYRARFGRKPPVFQVGRSQAGRDWPFIHPGPLDNWAGRRVHPFTIRFRLADRPCGVFTLRVEFADVHSSQPPTCTVTIGGRTARSRLKPGASDDSLVDPEAGKPQKLELKLPTALFRRGANKLVLTCTEGSWLLYDAVTLLHTSAIAPATR